MILLLLLLLSVKLPVQLTDSQAINVEVALCLTPSSSQFHQTNPGDDVDLGQWSECRAGALAERVVVLGFGDVGGGVGSGRLCYRPEYWER